MMADRKNPACDVAVDDVSPFGARAPTVSARLAWTCCRLHAAAELPGKAAWKRLGVRFRGPFDKKVDEMRLRIYPTDNFSDRTIALHHRLPERTERAMIKAYLPGGGTFVDVGANIGIFSIHASRMLGSRGRVLAIEPHPVTARKLAFNLRANRCANVEALVCALGASDGSCEFHPDSGKNAGRSSVIREAVGRPAAPVRVLMRTLLDVIDQSGIAGPDLLKIDVEGYEDRILAPFLAEAGAKMWPRAILLEDIHRDLWQTDIVSDMFERGYKQADRTDSNILLALD